MDTNLCVAFIGAIDSRCCTLAHKDSGIFNLNGFHFDCIGNPIFVFIASP